MDLTLPVPENPVLEALVVTAGQTPPPPGAHHHPLPGHIEPRRHHGVLQRSRRSPLLALLLRAQVEIVQDQPVTALRGHNIARHIGDDVRVDTRFPIPIGDPESVPHIASAPLRLKGEDPRHLVGDLLLAGGLARQIADPGECLGTRRHAQDQVKDDEHPGRGRLPARPRGAPGVGGLDRLHLENVPGEGVERRSAPTRAVLLGDEDRRQVRVDVVTPVGRVEEPSAHRLAQAARRSVEGGRPPENGYPHRALREQFAPLPPCPGKLPRHDDHEAQRIVVVVIDLQQVRRRPVLDVLHASHHATSPQP